MRIAIAITVLALAACSSEAPKQEEAPAITLQPGAWEMGWQVTQVLTPGAPLKAMKEAQSRTYCLKAEQAAKPEPAMFTEAKGNCSYVRDHISDGRMVLEITCPEGDTTNKGPLEVPTTTSSIAGSYTATSIDTDVDLSVYGGSQANYIAKAKLTGRRVGECSAEPPAKS